MKLALYSYGERRLILLIYLGELDGYVIGLDSAAVPVPEKNLLIQYKKVHPDASLQLTQAFLQKHCKTAYAKAYRKIKSFNLKLVKTYEI